MIAFKTFKNSIKVCQTNNIIKHFFSLKLKSYNIYKNKSEMNKCTNNNLFYSTISKHFRRKEQHQEEIKQEFYEPSETIIFHNKKCKIMTTAQYDRNIVNIFQYGSYILSALTGYKTIMNIIYFFPINATFWFLGLIMSMRIVYGGIANRRILIFEINLLEDGKTCEIILGSNKFNVDIKKIRRPSPHEALYTSTALRSANDFIPLVINEELYLMFKQIQITDRELFAAITNSKYIKVKADSAINKEDAIDIN